MQAWARGDREDVVAFKCLYVFARDEGYAVKEGWWPYVASRWADMYMHDAVWERGENGDALPPDTDGIDGSGVHVAIGCGGVGNGGFHVYSRISKIEKS